MAIKARGRVAPAAANGKHGHTLIGDAKFRQLYELMLRLRLGAQHANGHGQDLAGQAAALAAVSADLRQDDALLMEPIAGVPDLRLDPTVPIAPAAGRGTFSERVAEAVSAAAADRMRKNGRVTAIFAGPAPLLREAHAMASGARLPVLFVQTADPAGKIRGLGKAAGHLDENWLPSIPVDAQDVVALYRVAHESIVRAREGSGPTRIVCALWPAWDGHAEDAVEHLERWLEARGLPAHEWRREILAEVEGGARASEPHVPSLRIHASQEEKVLTEGL